MSASDSGRPATGTPRTSKWLFLVGAVVMTAGLLFGYDQGVIGGALRGIERQFEVGTLVSEIITSWVTLGALVGALIAGNLADRLGRRPTILLAAALFIVGAVTEAVAPGPAVLVGGRLVVGLGVGVTSVVGPLYAAEMAPSRLRGRFVSIYQLAITFGIFIAYLVDQLLAESGSWRLMLGLSVVAGVLLVLAILPLPDTAVWYAKAGRTEPARRVLGRMRPGQDVGREIDQIEQSLRGHRAGWPEVFSRKWRRPLVLGLGLAALQQLTGINGVIYYADKIFGAAGFHTPASQTAVTTWSVGAVNVLFTFAAVAFVDRLGRRPLLLAGLVGMGLSLLVIALCFVKVGQVTHSSSSPSNRPTDAGVILLVGVVVFIASYAFSLGPVVWTVINEIYPSSVRGLGVALATAVNWFTAWLVTQFFLSLAEWLGQSGAFGVFAAVCAVAFVFVWRLLPETKGRSLAEIQQMWLDEAKR